MNTKLKYINSLVLFSILSFTSCTSDKDEPQIIEGQGNITISLSVPKMGEVNTRGDWDNFGIDNAIKSEILSGELIQDWSVGIFQDGVLRTIVDRPDPSENDYTPLWNDQVKYELPKGKYTAIAFANMGKETMHELIKSLNLSDPEKKWKKEVIEYIPDEFENGYKVPMSGYLEDFYVEGTVNEEYSIELVRMLSKVEFAFRTLAAQDISITKISFQPLYKGNIFLFPTYPLPNPDTTNPGDEYKPIFPVDPESGYFTKTVSSNITLTKGSDVTERVMYYIKESVAENNHPTNLFHIGLTMKRWDSDEEVVSYALSDDKLKFICRNDYVLFPIVIYDYIPTFKVLDYPPIGGYPVKMDSNKVNEFYATFSESGDFDIEAKLVDSNGNTKVIKEYDGNPTSDYVRYDKVNSTVPEGFNLEYDNSLGVWKGNFPQGTGQRIILKFEFKIGQLIYKRTLFLLSDK